MSFIVTQIRLPRILACMLGGGSLAMPGVLLQTLTKNPLADSGIFRNKCRSWARDCDYGWAFWMLPIP